MADEGTERRGGLPTLAVAAGIVTMRLNRPAVHNRVDLEDLAELDRLVAADPAGGRAAWLEKRAPRFTGA